RVRDPEGAHPDELADGRVDQPRRVVVAIAAAWAVDEHDVLGLLAPGLQARLVRQPAEAGAALLLLVLRDDVVAGGDGARPRRVREDVHLGRARLLDHTER